MTLEEKTIEKYLQRTCFVQFVPKTVLFDMDGVLYDSMPLHAKAWKRVCGAAGIDAMEEEFFSYEGRTGASTINLLFNRQFGRNATDEECRHYYKLKTEFFREYPAPGVMPGAQDTVKTVRDAGLIPVIVTGSGQGSLLDRLDDDYDKAFTLRVTAYDVTKGKPDPEPYLAGLKKTGAEPWQGIGIDNAPLGVESASRAGVLTIGVRTGPVPKGSLLEAGADIELDSMTQCDNFLRGLLNTHFC